MLYTKNSDGTISVYSNISKKQLEKIQEKQNSVKAINIYNTLMNDDLNEEQINDIFKLVHQKYNDFTITELNRICSKYKNKFPNNKDIQLIVKSIDCTINSFLVIKKEYATFVYDQITNYKDYYSLSNSGVPIVTIDFNNLVIKDFINLLEKDFDDILELGEIYNLDYTLVVCELCKKIYEYCNISSLISEKIENFLKKYNKKDAQ